MEILKKPRSNKETQPNDVLQPAALFPLNASQEDFHFQDEICCATYFQEPCYKNPCSSDFPVEQRFFTAFVRNLFSIFWN